MANVRWLVDSALTLTDATLMSGAAVAARTSTELAEAMLNSCEDVGFNIPFNKCLPNLGPVGDPSAGLICSCVNWGWLRVRILVERKT